jgi:hypothetical protein
VWNVFITEDRTTIRKATVALSSYLEGDLHAGRLNVASTKLPRAFIFSLKGMSKVKVSSIYHLSYYQSCWRFDWQEVKSFQDESRAFIDVCNPFSCCMERLTILA